MSIKPSEFLNTFRMNKNISTDNYRFYTVLGNLTLMAVLGHIIFTLIFTWLHITDLVIFNIISTIVYFSCFFINKKGYTNQAFAVGFIEILIHAAVANLYLGWNSGYHYYVLLLIPLVFFLHTRKKAFKITLTILCCIFYIGLFYLLGKITPIYVYTGSALVLLNCSNIVMTFIAVSFITYHYNNAVIAAESSLKELNSKLTLLASTDPLTGLLNRRNMMEIIEHHISDFKCSKKSFTLILADIDNFKSYNDNYGHDCGDYIIINASCIMKQLVCENGFVARWGGEEFVILLPWADINTGSRMAETVRKELSESSFMYNGEKHSVTITLGVAEYNEDMSAAFLINKADNLLYIGKSSGKNCVIIDNPALYEQKQTNSHGHTPAARSEIAC